MAVGAERILTRNINWKTVIFQCSVLAEFFAIGLDRIMEWLHE